MDFFHHLLLSCISMWPIEAQLFNVKRNPVMEKDTITSIFNKLEILNFFYLRMSLSKAGKKSVNRLSSIQKEKKIRSTCQGQRQ